MILPATATSADVPPAGAAPDATTRDPNATERAADLGGIVRAALDTPRLTLDDMAAQLGISRARLESYRYPTRRMPGDVRRRLALLLAAHADELRRIADALIEVDGRSNDTL